MPDRTIRLLLADDDKDDCLFFEEALDELSIPAQLTTVHDGEQLMKFLAKKRTEELPQVLFLDLNLPRKNGHECLSEIKLDKKLKRLFVIIFSTSSEPDIVNLLYRNGAQHYIRKPAEFSQLKKVIQQALTIVNESLSAQPAGTSGDTEQDFEQPLKEHFVLTGDS